MRQWQPHSIRRLAITGLYQTFFTNPQRVGNNNTLYIDAIAPYHVPSGGSFSLSQFTLENLFDQHLRLRNWWTHSNTYFPLIRYLGCTITLYYHASIDYIFCYQNNFPMKANKLIYQSTQPSVMQLMRHRIIMPCKHYNTHKKGYKKVRIKPPPQLQNKWYFQQSISDIPLLNVLVSSCSLDRWYTNSHAKTPTIEFTTLNTEIWQLHNFKWQGTYGYQPAPNKLLFALDNGQHEQYEKEQFQNLIYLGNAFEYQEGQKISTAAGTTWRIKLTEYLLSRTKWGNPFMMHYLQQDKTVLEAATTWPQIISTLETKFPNTFTVTIKQLKDTIPFQELQQPNTLPVRYNPYGDKGTDNKVYLLHINEKSQTSWEPEDNSQLLSTNLPLWSLTWGLVDWYKRSNIIQTPETHSILVIQTTYTNSDLKYIVPLGHDFLDDRSTYFPTDAQIQRTVSDTKNWHPKLSFQLTAITEICKSGPGTPKLPDGISAEGHLKYKFKFKLGGSPPPMEQIDDPSKQQIWPLPNNFSDSTSLQSPATPFQHYLYHFDQRGDYLTKKAIKRLKTDYETKEPFSTTTGGSCFEIPPETTEESLSDTSEEEKEPQTLQQQLLQQQRQQLKLRHRINQLLKKLSKFE